MWLTAKCILAPDRLTFFTSQSVCAASLPLDIISLVVIDLIYRAYAHLSAQLQNNKAVPDTNYGLYGDCMPQVSTLSMCAFVSSP